MAECHDDAFVSYQRWHESRRRDAIFRNMNVWPCKRSVRRQHSASASEKVKNSCLNVKIGGW
jgi:hypothetical protein